MGRSAYVRILGAFSLQQIGTLSPISLMPKSGQVSQAFLLFQHITVIPCSNHEHLPCSGGGSMVGAVLGSTKQEPLVVGKPSTFMMDYLAKK
jgi:hypothetical protein